MSGEAGGLILLPLALLAIPHVFAGLVAIGAVAVGARAVSAAVRFERNHRKQRQAIRSRTSTSTSARTGSVGRVNTGGAERSVGNFRQEILTNMNEQTRLNVEASDKMMAELEKQRNELKRMAEMRDTQAFNQYVAGLKLSHAQTMQSISAVQNEFNVSYRNKIAESMSVVSQRINEQYSTYMGELQRLQSDMAEKNARAQEIAQTYIEEARTLLLALSEDFERQKFAPRQLMTLNDQFNQAVHLYNNGSYEGAIAAAKDTAVSTLEEIYDADAKKQEWENYYKLALVLSEEVKSYIESQETITQEVKEYAEKSSGQQLEDEIVGVKVAAYTDKNTKGQTRYDYLKHKADEVYTALHDGRGEQMTTEQLVGYVNFLNNELYPAATMCINKAIINMNNAFSRQNISEEIIDFFEEHNFMFNGYAYDDDCHDKALHIGLENEATGEELIITLAPELLENGDIQTHVDLKQIKGDEANEERKAYYRKCVEEVVKGNNPYAQVDIKCNSETKNKLSSDTETKKKLKM